MFIFLIFSLFHSHSASAQTSNPLSLEYKQQKLTAFIQAAEDASNLGTKPSTWTEIKSWKPVGKRFAAAYNANNELIAIYDLSYPNLNLSMLLGKIGRNPIVAQASKTAFLTAQSEVSEGVLSRDTQAAIGSLKNIDTVMDATYLHNDWWKTLPWNSASVTSEPASFRITDLNLGKIKIGAPLTSGLRKLLQAVLGDSGDLSAVSDHDLLGSFQFVRAADGGYEFRFTDPRTVSEVSRPKKLLELVNVHQGLYDSAEIALIEMGISQATALIPIPVVNALVSTAISRFSRYLSMIQSEHLELFHELMTETSEGSTVDPVLGKLSRGDQGAMVNAFEWSRVSPTDIWKFIFNHPDKAWSKGQQSDSDTASASKAWLVSNRFEVSDLNQRFSFGTNTATASRFLYLDSAAKVSKNKGPVLSIDYANPGSIAKDRLEKEWIGAGIEFASNFVPVAGFAVNEAYGLLVQNAIDTAQLWEARMLEVLEAGSGTWDTEISILQNQRINPLERDHTAMEQLIQNRRQSLGL